MQSSLRLLQSSIGRLAPTAQPIVLSALVRIGDPRISHAPFKSNGGVVHSFSKIALSIPTVPTRSKGVWSFKARIIASLYQMQSSHALVVDADEGLPRVH